MKKEKEREKAAEKNAIFSGHWQRPSRQNVPQSQFDFRHVESHSAAPLFEPRRRDGLHPQSATVGAENQKRKGETG